MRPRPGCGTWRGSGCGPGTTPTRYGASPAPAAEFRIELTAPDGRGSWAYGPAEAAERVTGPALDFCLLVTQRAHRADLALTATGPEADRWLDIAQAFAGPAGPGRAPGASR